MIDAELLVAPSEPIGDASAVPAPVASAASAASEPPREERVRRMIDEHLDTVGRTLQRMGVRQDSLDDAIQQTFVVAARKLDVIECGGERRYLLGIAVRVAADSRRARARRREVPEQEAGAIDERAAPLPSIEELVDQKRARELLDDVLGSMPDELRTAFVLFELEGLVVPEIATALRIPQGTVASRIRKAREVFRKRVRQLTPPPKGGAR